MIIPEGVKEDLEWDLVRTHLDRMVEHDGNSTPAQGVRELHIELTHRCNLKCVMCEHWEMERLNPDSVRREMDLEKIKALVSGSRTLDGVTGVAVTGGEGCARTSSIVASPRALASRHRALHFGTRGDPPLAQRVEGAGARLRPAHRRWAFEKTHDAVRGERALAASSRPRGC